LLSNRKSPPTEVSGRGKLVGYYPENIPFNIPLSLMANIISSKGTIYEGWLPIPPFFTENPVMRCGNVVIQTSSTCTSLREVLIVSET
jgi:hypothetical protein